MSYLKMRKFSLISLCIILLCYSSFLGSEQKSKKGAKKIRLGLMARGFQKPLQVIFSPGDFGAMYIVEQGGKIYRLKNKKRRLFADLSKIINSGAGEEGLLGLAFPPKYNPDSSFCYVNYTAKRNPAYTYITELRVQKKRVSQSPATRRVLLRFKQPYRNHNGGFLVFGPDGKLYIGTGDGGGAGDPLNAGQDLNTLLGKILRIDARPSKSKPYSIPRDNPFTKKAKARPEIYAWGLRNPWRFSFDAQTRRLYAADVGQDRFEEINLIVKGGNYGWRRKEGYQCYKPRRNCAPKRLNLIEPIHSYGHKVGQSITGGYVYRGQKLPALRGHYFFADYVRGALWALPLTRRGHAKGKALLLKKNSGNISSFGEDTEGELYMTDHQKGLVYKLLPP